MLDPNRIRRVKRVDGAYTPDEWLACLTTLAQTDRRGDQIRKALVAVAAVAGIGGIIGGLVAESIVVAGVGVLVAGVALAAFGFLRQSDLPNRLLAFLVPCVRLLREEMAPGAPLRLTLDLRGGPIQAKQVGQRRSGGGYPSTVETDYDDPWLTGEARLADGTRLAWQVTDHIRERKVTRRNPRGKTKTKTKYKVQTAFDVRVALPTDDYAPLATAAGGAAGDRLRLRPGEARTVCRVRRVVESRHPDAPLDVRHLLDLIAGAYSQVAPAGGGGGGR